MNLKHIFLGVAALFVAAATLTFPSLAQDKAAFDAKQKEAIRTIVKEYLLEKPEIIRDAFAELSRRQEEAASENRQKALSSLYKETTPYSTGDGKVTLVEFFDYNCGYCRKAFDQIASLSKEEKDLRVVFIEFPILSEGSRIASQAAIASAKQGKYWEFHRAMMNYSGPIDSEAVFKVAADTGLDVEKLKTDMKTPEVNELIEKNLALRTSMGVQGTPAFFIGDEAIPGAPQELKSILKSAVANIREKGCKAC